MMVLLKKVFAESRKVVSVLFPNSMYFAGHNNLSDIVLLSSLIYSQKISDPEQKVGINGLNE